MADLTPSIAICYKNWVIADPTSSAKTVTATTSATGYAATNLSTPQLYSSWRSTTGSLTSQNVDVDLGASRDIGVIALIGTNLTTSATRSPVTSESNLYTSPEYNPGSGNVFDNSNTALLDDSYPYGKHLLVFPPTTLNSRYVRLTLNDSTNPSNYLSSRVYWVGPIFQPGISFSMKEGSVKKRREIIGDPGLERFITYLEIQLDVLSEAEGRALESICSAKLRSGRLLVVLRPTQQATWQGEALYCIMAGLPTLASFPQGAGLIYWKLQLVFKECED